MSDPRRLSDEIYHFTENGIVPTDGQLVMLGIKAEDLEAQVAEARKLIEKWRKKMPSSFFPAWDGLRCADELEAVLDKPINGCYLNTNDVEHLVAFINLFNPSHDCIEPEIINKLGVGDAQLQSRAKGD